MLHRIPPVVFVRQGLFRRLLGLHPSRPAQPARQAPFRIRGRVIARDAQQELTYQQVLRPTAACVPQGPIQALKQVQRPVQPAPRAPILIRGRVIARNVLPGHTRLQVCRPTAACVPQGPIQVWEREQQPVQSAQLAPFLIPGRFIVRNVQQGHTCLQAHRPTAASVVLVPIQLLEAQTAQRALQAPFRIQGRVIARGVLQVHLPVQRRKAHAACVPPGCTHRGLAPLPAWPVCHSARRACTHLLWVRVAHT